MKSIYIEISNACNLKCTFCPSPGLKTQRQFMSVESFEKTLKQIGSTVNELYFHVLGEPLLHPHLKTFFDLAHKQDKQVNLTTNGIFIAKQCEVLLSSQSLRQINFSVHALQELKDDELALKHCDEILDFIQLALVRKPELFINLRLWNEGTASSITSEISIFNQKLREKIEKRFAIKVDEKPFNPRYKSQNLFARTYLHSDTRFEWPGHTKEHQRSNKGTCRALDTHCAILVDGTVVPCCLDYKGDIGLGNINEDRVESILSGERAFNMREGFKKGLLVEDLCQSCQFCKRFG